VDAVAVSVLTGILVVSEKVASFASARAEMLSAAVQAIVTSAACHSASGVPQVTSGEVVSILSVSDLAASH